MKKCFKCKTDKNDEDFIIRKNGRLNSWCKECVREKARESYGENREKCINRGKIKNLKFRQYIFNYLKNNPCVDCGEKDPIVLQFDHIKDKKYNISDMKMMSFEKVDEEIKKCDVRCANCHVRKTAKQFGYYSFEKLNMPT